MNREVRSRMRPWTQGPAGPSVYRGRPRREKVTITVPTVDTYRKHMDHVQVLYTRLRLVDDPEHQSSIISSSSTTALPPLPLYAMKRSHTFAGVSNRSPREFSDPRANPLPYQSLLEFSAMDGSVSHRPSAQSSSAESLISPRLSLTNESLDTEDRSDSHHNQFHRQNRTHRHHNSNSHHRFPRKSHRKSSKSNPQLVQRESWVDDSNEQGTVSHSPSPKEEETEDNFRLDESHFSEDTETIEFKKILEDLQSSEQAKTPTFEETDEVLVMPREDVQSPEYVIYSEDESVSSQHPHDKSQTTHYPDDVSEDISLHSDQRNGWTSSTPRQQRIHNAASNTRKENQETDDLSSGIGIKSTSYDVVDGGKDLSLKSLDKDSVSGFAGDHHEDDLKHRSHCNGGHKKHKRTKREKAIRRKVEHAAGDHWGHAEHSEGNTPRQHHDNDDHQPRRQSEDHTDYDGVHHPSTDNQQIDILQLCEHLKTQGLGDPVMSTQSNVRTRFSNSLPPGVKARCLPRNPSKREKIKGRARLDYELANMRAAAFCEQQQSNAFRTASADLRDRDVRLLEEEERENLKKSLDATARGHAYRDELEDDESSIVGNPLSREELFFRIEAWAEDVHDALNGGHS